MLKRKIFIERITNLLFKMQAYDSNKRAYGIMNQETSNVSYFSSEVSMIKKAKFQMNKMYK